MGITVGQTITSIVWASSSYTDKIVWAYRIGHMLFYNLRFKATVNISNEVSIATFGLKIKADQTGISGETVSSR